MENTTDQNTPNPVTAAQNPSTNATPSTSAEITQPNTTMPAAIPETKPLNNPNNSSATQSQSIKNTSKKPIYFSLAIIMLLIGIVIGYFIQTPKKSNTLQNNNNTKKTTSLTLPANAVRIQTCSDHRGALFVKPEDIPTGPVYMVNKGQVIGLEYMIAQNDVLAGQTYKALSGLGMNVDHINVGLLEHGHAGYTIPHYHIDLYLVKRNIEEAITCPPGSDMEMNMDMSSSGSATVSPTQPMQTSTMPSLLPTNGLSTSPTMAPSMKM